jgi:hypothetical protein
MFTQFYNHPLFNEEECKKFRERWKEDDSGRDSYEYNLVRKLIAEEGAGKHFLNYDYHNGNLPCTEYEGDLRGFHWWKIERDFKDTGDTFRGIDFTYSKFWHSEVENAVFASGNLDFTKHYKMTFKNCIFAFSNFLGATFENCKFINCDFAEPCNFESAKFVNTEFDSCFFGEVTPFSHCSFDELTLIKNTQMKSNVFKNVEMKKDALSGLYKSLSEGYENGGAFEKSEDFFWKAKKSYTRYNTKGLSRIFLIINELLTGYGTKPLRPFIVMILCYLSAVAVFTKYIALKDSIVFSAGAFFTFGAESHHIQNFGILGRAFYVFLSFVGISMTALFITTLANNLFKSRIPSASKKDRYS